MDLDLHEKRFAAGIMLSAGSSDAAWQ